MVVKIKLEEGVEMPKYQTAGSVGMDLSANIKSSIYIAPFERRLILSGVSIELPRGYEAQVRPRSGLSLRKGLVATLGTIDTDYRGVIGIIMTNTSSESQLICPQERIAQLVFAKVERAELSVSPELSETERGAGGFRSTGTTRFYSF